MNNYPSDDSEDEVFMGVISEKEKALIETQNRLSFSVERKQNLGEDSVPEVEPVEFVRTKTESSFTEDLIVANHQEQLELTNTSFESAASHVSVPNQNNPTSHDCTMDGEGDLFDDNDLGDDLLKEMDNLALTEIARGLHDAKYQSPEKQAAVPNYLSPDTEDDDTMLIDVYNISDVRLSNGLRVRLNDTEFLPPSIPEEESAPQPSLIESPRKSIFVSSAQTPACSYGRESPAKVVSPSRIPKQSGSPTNTKVIGVFCPSPIKDRFPGMSPTKIQSPKVNLLPENSEKSTFKSKLVTPKTKGIPVLTSQLKGTPRNNYTLPSIKTVLSSVKPVKKPTESPIAQYLKTNPAPPQVLNVHPQDEHVVMGFNSKFNKKLSATQSRIPVHSMGAKKQPLTRAGSPTKRLPYVHIPDLPERPALQVTDILNKCEEEGEHRVTTVQPKKVVSNLPEVFYAKHSSDLLKIKAESEKKFQQKGSIPVRINKNSPHTDQLKNTTMIVRHTKPHTTVSSDNLDETQLEVKAASYSKTLFR